VEPEGLSLYSQSLTLGPILSHLISVHTFAHYLSKIPFSAIRPVRFSDQNFAI